MLTVEEAGEVAKPYLEQLAALKGAIEILLDRNPAVKEGDVTKDDCYKFVKDFRLLYTKHLREILYPGENNDSI